MPDPVAACQVSRYETELTRRFGVPYAVAVASGTAALHCALASCGIGPGDEVLVPAVSVVMSVAPVCYLGAQPVFVDCGPSGADFSYEDLAAKVTTRTKAVVPVYLWGRAGDPARLADFAAEHGLEMIEDACQAHGTLVRGRLAGTFGSLGCFSTKDGKLLWSGEGGFILTEDEGLAERCRALRTHWQAPPRGEAPLSQLGFNYRLAEPLAAIARDNLTRFGQSLARRQQQARLLAAALARTPGESPPWTREKTGMATRHWRESTWPGHAASASAWPRLGFPTALAHTGWSPATSVRCSLSSPGSPATQPASFIESLLAVVLTEHDDDERIERYADIITQEAAQWADRY